MRARPPEGPTSGPPGRSRSVDLERLDVRGRRALRALLGVVAHLRALGERLEAAPLDRAVVHEQVLAAVIGRDESEALVVVEPLHGSCCHLFPLRGMCTAKRGGCQRATTAETRARLRPDGRPTRRASLAARTPGASPWVIPCREALTGSAHQVKGRDRRGPDTRRPQCRSTYFSSTTAAARSRIIPSPRWTSGPPRTWRRTWPSSTTSPSCSKPTGSTSTGGRSRPRRPGCVTGARTPRRSRPTVRCPRPTIWWPAGTWSTSSRTSAPWSSRPTSPPSPARVGGRCTSGSTSGRSCPGRPPTTDPGVIDEPTRQLDEGALRALVPRVLAGLVRRGEDFDAAEDALQEALLEALRVWPEHPPHDPRAWLATVATRRLVDARRSEAARRRREEAEHAEPPGGPVPEAGDDTLFLLFCCCHPALPPASQVALTLRAVGGLTTREIADAFYVPEATMAQRISRAKRTLAGPPVRRLDQPGDLAVVLRVLYLIYTAGHAGRVDLAGEAIRLGRQLTLATQEPEARGLLALMLINHARLAARFDAEGRIVTLDRQDRSRWDTRAIAEGVRVLQSALAMQTDARPPGRYQVEAAIAALHADAASAEETDWRQILAWYDDLVALTDDPVRQDP